MVKTSAVEYGFLAPFEEGTAVCLGQLSVAVRVARLRLLSSLLYFSLSETSEYSPRLEPKKRRCICQHKIHTFSSIEKH
jgi:hypothetical protein